MHINQIPKNICKKHHQNSEFMAVLNVIGLGYTFLCFIRSNTWPLAGVEAYPGPTAHSAECLTGSGVVGSLGKGFDQSIVGDNLSEVGATKSPTGDLTSATKKGDHLKGHKKKGCLTRKPFMLFLFLFQKGMKVSATSSDADVLPQEGTSGKQRSICSASAKRSNTSSTCLGCGWSGQNFSATSRHLGKCVILAPKIIATLQTKSTTETRFIRYSNDILWCHWSTEMILLDFLQALKPNPCLVRSYTCG